MKYIIEIPELDGDETEIYLEADGVSVESLYAVIEVQPDGAGIIDNGYRSIAEAKQAWPEAIVPRAAALTPSAIDAHYTINGGEQTSKSLSAILGAVDAALSGKKVLLATARGNVRMGLETERQEAITTAVDEFIEEKKC